MKSTTELLSMSLDELEAYIAQQFGLAYLEVVKKLIQEEEQKILYGDPNSPKPIGFINAQEIIKGNKTNGRKKKTKNSSSTNRK